MKDTQQSADVTLILEGTYPFVRGGVSAWVHDLVTGMPELKFSLVYLGAEASQQQMRYDLPPNVIDLRCHYIMDANEGSKPLSRRGDRDYFSDSEKLHAWFRNPDRDLDKGLIDRAILQADRKTASGTDDFFYSEEAWNEIQKNYRRYCPTASFNAYFWSVRNMHGPLMKLASIVRTVPPSPLFHVLTTGYAGLLGAMAARLRKRPLILTEHGIYTKERKIDLQAAFLQQSQAEGRAGAELGMEHSQRIWMRLFEGIGRLVYDAADPIITLFEQNRQRQIRDGANPSRTLIIPNGVDVERYAPLRLRRQDKPPLILGLIGRIVPIKDVKTFIRSIAKLATRLPDVQGWLIGPEEEDPEYVAQCKELVVNLGLENRICFMGFQKVDDVLPRLGLLVLSSISEAFPLVIGESFASGLPVVATDVGACRELIEGRDGEDRNLGCGGAVVPIADAERLAGAAYELLTNEAHWSAAQKAGIERVERYYRQAHVIDQYRRLYNTVGGA